MIWIKDWLYKNEVTGRQEPIEGVAEVIDFLKKYHPNKIREYIASRNRGYSPAIAQGTFNDVVKMDSRSCEPWMHALEVLTLDARAALEKTTEIIQGVGIRSNGEWLWNKEMAQSALQELIARESLKMPEGQMSLVQHQARRELRALD